jgi:hypothetical protein
MIMCPASSHGKHHDRCPWVDRFLVYAECLNIVTQANGSLVEPSLGLHVLKRATHASGAPLQLGPVLLRLSSAQLSSASVSSAFGTTWLLAARLASVADFKPGNGFL